jgi:hypothetical protein
MHQDADCELGDGSVPLQNILRPLGDLIVSGLRLTGMHIDLVGDRLHAPYALDRRKCCNLLVVAFHVTRKCDYPVFDGDTDMFGVDAGIKLKLVKHVLMQHLIAHVEPP